MVIDKRKTSCLTLVSIQFQMDIPAKNENQILDNLEAGLKQICDFYRLGNKELVITLTNV